jgi:hypothetical protein
MMPPMRRLARHALTAFSALSLLLCVAVCVLWVRSHWVADTVVYTRPSGSPASVTLWSSSGYLALRRWEPPEGSAFQVQQRWWAYAHGPAVANNPSRFLNSPDSRRVLGVVYFDFTWTRRNSPFNGVRERAVLVPYWMPMAAFGAWPLVRLLSRHRRRRAARAAAGLCTECGYDLRASPGRCPECGAEGPRAGA